MVHVWSINSGERFQGHRGPLVFFFHNVFKRIFSSPEHNVIKRGAFRVVICPLSVICRASCVVNNFFKHLLLNRWANLDQTWQECSLRGPLQKLFTEFDSIKTLVAMATKLNFLSNSLKIFSSGTIGPILNNFTEMFLG